MIGEGFIINAFHKDPVTGSLDSIGSGMEEQLPVFLKRPTKPLSNVLNRKKDTFKNDLICECKNCICSLNQYGF